MKNTLNSSNLFLNPSFVSGMASVLDLGTTLQKYNTSETENEADTEALKRDWQIVGKDLTYSIKKYEQELSESTK